MLFGQKALLALPNHFMLCSKCCRCLTASCIIYTETSTLCIAVPGVFIVAQVIIRLQLGYGRDRYFCVKRTMQTVVRLPIGR